MDEIFGWTEKNLEMQSVDYLQIEIFRRYAFKKKNPFLKCF